MNSYLSVRIKKYVMTPHKNNTRKAINCSQASALDYLFYLHEHQVSYFFYYELICMYHFKNIVVRTMSDALRHARNHHDCLGHLKIINNKVPRKG